MSHDGTQAEVTKGGGFAFLAAGYGGPQVIRQELSDVRALLEIPAADPLPVGVAYFGWKFEEPGHPVEDMLNAALEARVRAIWLSFGRDLGRWVEHTRRRVRDAGLIDNTLIFVLVNSLDEAMLAINEWKADVIVAQGIEAGGHGSNYAPPTFSLVSSILEKTPGNRPPIIAAGGLSNGSQVAAYLTLGASGAVLGTRFLLTPESPYTDGQKNALLSASADLSVRTLAFDHARNTLGWPEGIDGRGLRNEIVKDFDAGVDISNLREKVQEAVKSGNPGYMVTWAGLGVGDMTEIKPAKAIIRQLHEQIKESLQASALLISANGNDA
ncbi:NPD-domain-containing protein [Panus rudis PR-1116 ss-1]|nr:NPD-domain-containing protein [Panus rudis PR-1116 ss-1]